MESLWRHCKNSKTTCDAYLCLRLSSIHTYQKYLNPSGGPVPLRCSSAELKLTIMINCDRHCPCGEDDNIPEKFLFIVGFFYQIV